MIKRFFGQIIAGAIVLFARAITAVRGVWQGVAPNAKQRVYFANHTSNGDFILLWAALPPQFRRHTRPVAAADYWLKNKLRAFIGREVVRAVLIERNPENRSHDPVRQMVKALDSKASLILFPEGQRNQSEATLLPFKSGLYHLAKACPEVEFIPVWIENLNRVLPKGEVIPVPIICSVIFGAPVPWQADKAKFLNVAEKAVLNLRPEGGHD